MSTQTNATRYRLGFIGGGKLAGSVMRGLVRAQFCTPAEILVSELWPTAHRLVAHGETLIRFTPVRLGRFPFTCRMGMYSGEISVHERSKT